jgi:hypothetical protein
MSDKQTLQRILQARGREGNVQIEVTIHSVIADEGSVIVFGACRSDNGENVRIGVDRRPAQAIIEALEHEDVTVDCEVWQLL